MRDIKNRNILSAILVTVLIVGVGAYLVTYDDTSNPAITDTDVDVNILKSEWIDDDSVEVTIQVYNTGNKAVKNLIAHVSLDDDSGQIIASKDYFFGVLPAGESQTEIIYFSVRGGEGEGGNAYVEIEWE